MAGRRPDSDDSGRSKRQKTSSTDIDPKENPYLAHMYEEEDVQDAGYNGGYGKPTNFTNGRGNYSALAGFPRHRTTAAMAKEAEDGPDNPFNGKPLSPQYFNILKTRRNLPVHAQR
jgi:pre-mRNA-splicing factor ATP-dependent RNA helicase DHX15/PRP43